MNAHVRRARSKQEIYAPTKLAHSQEQWTGKPPVLLADMQQRRATRPMPGCPQTSTHSHKLHQNTQGYTRYSLTEICNAM